jgi:SAM-dependent methyltransferase
MMESEPNKDRGVRHYDEVYKTGGWKYSFWREYFWHRQHVVKRFGLRRGMRMLEVACGCGFHTNLFSRMGFDCVGVDRSEAGIEWARSHYPNRTYHCCDYREVPLEPGSFDVVVARGLSSYHYDLASDEAFEASRTIMKYLKPGGVFIMLIITDLSGRRDPGSVWHNTLDDYRRHFSSFGKRWSVDWFEGVAMCGLHNEPVEGGALEPPVLRETAAPAT